MGHVAFVGIVLSVIVLGGSAQARDPLPGMVTMMHYFAQDMGRQGLNRIFTKFQADANTTVFDNPIGHEDFKTSILTMLDGGYPPDLFSYWAGARTADVVARGHVQPIDDLWEANGLSKIVPAALATRATSYDGKRYFIPFGYHFVGLFYNRRVFAAAGIDKLPETWPEFLDICRRLKAHGVTPLALGAANRWPAQFWFDYLLLRTAGPEFHTKLTGGRAAFTDPEVVRAMEMWRQLLDAGYFNADAADRDWNDAADGVGRGTAAMTLMGTWIGGYWEQKQLKAGTDYDLFPFPAIDPGVPKVAVGPIDGFLIPAQAQNAEQAKRLAVYLLKDADVQAIWAESQGALSPNRNVDKGIYNSVMTKARREVSGADRFAFAYDLAAPPKLADIGLSMFVKFIERPADLTSILASTQQAVRDASRP